MSETANVKQNTPETLTTRRLLEIAQSVGLSVEPLVWPTTKDEIIQAIQAKIDIVAEVVDSFGSTDDARDTDDLEQILSIGRQYGFAPPLEGEVVDETPADALPESTEIALRETKALALQSEWSVDDLLAQMGMIERAMKEAMREGHHYGKIPGVDKPSLLKPGAEKLAVLFRMRPHYEREIVWHDDGHLTVVSTCHLTHITSGQIVGEGGALCTTRETRYAYRTASRRCPACGAEMIIKGKAEYGGGWVCFKKKGGCGAKFEDGTAEVESQEVGRVDNEAVADVYNTVLKMADKRALVAATLVSTAASDVFTQDAEDMPVAEVASTTERATPTPAQETSKPTGAPGYLPPKDWKEGVERLGKLLGYPEDAAEWIRLAIAAKFGEGKTLNEQEPAAKVETWQGFNKTLALLVAYEGDLALEPNLRGVVGRAFYDGMGVELSGPRWRISASETGLPTKQEVEALEASKPSSAQGAGDNPTETSEALKTAPESVQSASSEDPEAEAAAESAFTGPPGLASESGE